MPLTLVAMFLSQLDRQRLVDLYQGTTQAINLPWSPNSPAYDPTKNKTYTFDLDKARSLLNSMNSLHKSQPT